MRRHLSIYAAIMYLAIAGATLSLRVYAQSARVAEAPRGGSAPPDESPAPLTVQSQRLPIDPGAARYRLIFPVYYEGVLRKGELYYVGTEDDRARPSINNSFIEQLNKAGQEGYRLRSITGAFPIAIVELDEVKYEYAWFLTAGPLSTKEGFFGAYSEFSRQGFTLVANFLVGKNCEDINLIESVPLETCTFEDFFLVERPQGVVRTRDSRLAFTGPVSHRETGPQLTADIKEKLAQGFYPTSVLSKFEILLERSANEGAPVPQDVRVVTTGWRDKLETKVNELAKQGYRLGLINHGIAVMYRTPAGKPLSYFWLDAKKKGFENQLARLQAQGAVYRMTYPTDEGVDSKLIFEQTENVEARRREYKVLKFDFQYAANAAEKKVHKKLTPASEETVKLMNTLAKEGFVVRGLFISDEVSVILERAR